MTNPPSWSGSRYFYYPSFPARPHVSPPPAGGSAVTLVLKEKPGGVFRVLRSAGALQAIRGLVGEESDYQSAYAYLRNHAASMDYCTCRRLRTPIGSGITEAACKILFTQRFKRAGMKWNIEDGKPILALRVIALSKLWSTVRGAWLEACNMSQPRTPRTHHGTSAKIAA